MSGGHLDYIRYDLESLADTIEDGVHPRHDEGVFPSDVSWDRDVLLAFIRDLADLLHAYEWWKSGDTREEKYRDAEELFMEKWDLEQAYTGE